MKTAIKLMALAAMAFVGYKGVQAYALLQFGQHMADCGVKEQVCPLIASRAGARALTDAMNESLSCVATRQSFVESLVLPVARQKLTSPSGDEHMDWPQAQALCGH